MSFCPNCGRQLADGEICPCTVPTGDDTVVISQADYPQAQAQPQPQPEAPQQPYAQNVPPMNGAYYAPQDPNFVAPVYAPPAEPVARTDYPEGYKIKKKYVAVILAYAFGVFGLHNFYLGNKNRGLTQLLVATVGGIFTLGLGTTAVAIWSIIEAIGLLVEKIDADANGYKIQTLEEAIEKATNKE